MKLDREYQRELLTKMADAYPHRCRMDYVLPEPTEEDEARYAANMAYLEEHDLTESGITYGMSELMFTAPKITAAGMDFIADDGGLTAILGMVTIKLHDEALREVIGKQIEGAPLSSSDKKKWTDQLRSLPADSIKHLTMKLLDKGLERAPDALRIIESFLL
jgi:hypothetical protein